ncbi:MAG TPA: metal ABC transporter permease [Acidimicrobiales bacterium]|nr:metal ABC transporter permease [Acidimicrobiales bacterium]
MVALVARVATPKPSWNLAHDVNQLFSYAFMRHAFVAGTIVAVLAGVVGYFVVLRQSSFAAHALSEIGFAGASGGVVYGFGAVTGLLVMSLLGAALIGLLGKRLRGRDAVIGTVLAFSLGLGSYFLTRYKGNASGAFGLLFGEILGISVHDIWVIAIAGALTLVVTAAVFRPLLFASLDEDVAEARGVPVRALSVLFFLVVAVAVTAAVQIVGVLLIFSLLVTPGAIADRVCRTPGRAVALCVGLSVVFVWAGLTVTYYSDFPVGFLITAFAFGCYLLVRLVSARPRQRWTPRSRTAEPATGEPAEPAAAGPGGRAMTPLGSVGVDPYQGQP